MNYVLLTGGLGFIGSNTAVELVNSGYNIIIIDDLSNSKRDVLERIRKLCCCEEKIIFYECNILDISRVDEIIEKYSIECVIHFAAFKSVNESIREPLKYYENNIIGLINILGICVKRDINNFIFSSSATVYGNAQSPLYENSNTGCGITNPYGYTKFMAENIIRDVCMANQKKNFKAVCLRYFNPVGAHPSGLLGEDPNDIPNNLMPFVLRVAIRNNIDMSYGDEYKELSIFGNDYNTEDGTCKRDFIHVVDLAKAHVATRKYINESDSRENFDVFNIGTGKGTSVLEIVETFKKINNVKLPYIFKDRRFGDIETVFCNCDKALQKIGWSANLGIEDICRDAYTFAKYQTT